MQSWRNNPESEANQKATKNHEREVFALKMQAFQDSRCEECNGTGLTIADDDCSYCNGTGVYEK